MNNSDVSVLELQRKIILSFVIGLFLLGFIIFFGIKYFHDRNMNELQINLEDQISLSLTHSLEHNQQTYSALLEEVINDDIVKKSLKNGNREELLSYLKPKFKRWQKNDKHLKLLHFYTPDGVTLLRVHRPEFYGDELGSIRPMIKKIQSDNRAIFGFESGETFTSYRVLLPIKEGDVELGFAEIGFDPLIMISQLKAISGYEAAFFCKNGLHCTHNVEPMIVVDGYHISERTSKEISQILQELIRSEKFTLKDNYHFEHNGRTYILHTFDLKTFSGATNSKIILFQDVSEYAKHKKYLEQTLLGAILILFAILMFIFKNQIKNFRLDIKKVYMQQIEEIQRSRQKLHDFYENSNDMYASIDAKTKKITYCNIAFANKLGFATKDEIISKECFEIYHEDSLEHVKNNIFPTFVKTGKVHEEELVLKRKDGTRLYASLDVNAIRDEDGNVIASQSILHDLTEIHNTKKELQFNLSYLQSVFDTEPNIIITTYGDKIDRANDTFFKFTDFENIEAFKEKYDCICDLFEDEEGYLQKNIGGVSWLAYIYAHPLEEHKVIISKKSKKNIFAISANLLKFDEKNRSIVVLSDITQQHEMQQEIKAKEELMIAQSRQGAMGDMVAMIAHQWRQPITVISMALNNLKADIALEEEITTKKLQDMSNEILEQTQHLSQTIDDFRNFFKPNKEKEPVSVCKVMDSAIGMMGKSFESSNIAVEIKNGCKNEIMTFANELLQVFLNIINNAKDALTNSKVSDAIITIKIDDDEKHVTVTICDNGGGIPKDILARLGEPYVSSKAASGSGLGIYMSKTIVEKHLNGMLEWENRDGGACFTIRLPHESAKELS